MLSNPQAERRKLLNLFYKKNFEKALELYTSILSYFIDDPDFRKLGGDIYFNLGMTQAAVGEYRQALNLYRKENKLNQALAVAEKIKNLDKEDSEIFQTLGELYLQQNNKQKAAQNYGEYLRRLFKNGESGKAQRLLQKIRRDGLEEYLSSQFGFVLSKQELNRILEDISKEKIYVAFFALLKKELARAERYKREFSIILSECDRILNQDERMRLKDVCQKTLRESDIYSLGSRWFFIILPETNKYGAEGAVNRLKKQLKATNIGVQFYVASYPTDGTEVKELIVAALRYRIPY